MATLADYNTFIREQGHKPKWMRHTGDGFIYPVTATNYLYPHLELITEEQAFPDPVSYTHLTLPTIYSV